MGWQRGVLLLVTADALALAIGLMQADDATAARSQRAYTTSPPNRNPPWLGLAAQDGHYEILLGDDCQQIGPDMNVLLERGDAANEAVWRIRLDSTDQECSVAEWHWMGNLPCVTNDVGDCDVTNA
jgi:hypothetical protein